MLFENASVHDDFEPGSRARRGLFVDDAFLHPNAFGAYESRHSHFASSRSKPPMISRLQHSHLPFELNLSAVTSDGKISLSSRHHPYRQRLVSSGDPPVAVDGKDVSLKWPAR
jgi:hypothetical protein